MNRTEEDFSIDCRMDPTLTVELSTHEQLCVLRMTGELNHSSVPALQAQMDQIGCSQCYEVLLDLTALRGVDVTGLGALVRLDRHIRRDRSKDESHRCTGRDEAEARQCPANFEEYWAGLLGR